MTDQHSEDLSYIKAAAELRLRFDSWKIDQEFKNNGGKIFYAVDTDIVIMFSSPSRTSKYSAVFPGDDKQTREILTWALGRFIFFQLTDSLLIIPPHHLELENVLMVIARNALKEIGSIAPAIDKIERYLKQYQSTDKTDKMDDLISMFNDNSLDILLFAFGGGKGPTAELSRITTLLRDERILHSERHME
ncbi:hypothetical protein MBAV_002621, partial [Candidatus Magnetobacterium bavaricum]